MLSSQHVRKGWLLICARGPLAPHAVVILSMGRVSLNLGGAVGRDSGALVVLVLAPCYVL